MRVLMKAYCLLWNYSQYFWIIIHVLIRIIHIIIYLCKQIFMRFNKIIMIFIDLIEQFDFDLSILYKSRIMYHMITCDIKIFGK